MKTLKLLILSFLAYVQVYGQTGPIAPSSGIWAIIDTSYNVGTTNGNYYIITPGLSGTLTF